MEEKISVYNIVKAFNRSEFRRKAIPQELSSGWPCIRMYGKTLCITIPYYAKKRMGERIALKPLYCSVTFPLGNVDRILDYTIYPYQRDWADVDYTKPAGYFKHEALAEVTTKAEYQGLCKQLYEYYDAMVAAILAGKPFEEEQQMKALFSKLMEPGHFNQYQKINNKFYSCFCQL